MHAGGLTAPPPAKPNEQIPLQFPLRFPRSRSWIRDLRPRFPSLIRGLRPAESRTSDSSMAADGIFDMRSLGYGKGRDTGLAVIRDNTWGSLLIACLEMLRAGWGKRTFLPERIEAKPGVLILFVILVMERGIGPEGGVEDGTDCRPASNFKVELHLQTRVR